MKNLTWNGVGYMIIALLILLILVTWLNPQEDNVPFNETCEEGEHCETINFGEHEEEMYWYFYCKHFNMSPGTVYAGLGELKGCVDEKEEFHIFVKNNVYITNEEMVEWYIKNDMS